MRNLKRAVSAILCAAMLVTTNGITTLAAQADRTGGVENTAGLADTERMEDTERVIGAEYAADTENSIELSTEAAVKPESTELSTEVTGEPENTAVIDNMKLTYLVFGSSYVETPGQQYALVGIGDGTYALQQAVLYYRNQTTGEQYICESDTLDTDAALFYMDFPDASYAGSYELTKIVYTAEGTTGEIVIADTGMDAVFGVDQEVEAEPDAVAMDAATLEDMASTLITDAEGNVLSEAELGEVIANANSQVGKSDEVRATGLGDIVVVLDPGHGGTDPGATRTINGITYAERDLVLKIANYCKTELETYAGVKVYLTRTDNTSSNDSRDVRVRKAQQWGADILVSFHLNSTEAQMGTANGAEIYVPSENYNVNYPYHAVGDALGNKILSQLQKLGLANNGTKIRLGQVDRYPDGSVVDYLGINYYSKLYGYPFAGILIEHAFINNYNDVVYYLSSEDKLKKLGVADATGIAEYYGLQKKNGIEIPQFTKIIPAGTGTLQLSWSSAKKPQGYYLYRAESENGKYKKIATIAGAKSATYTDTGLTNGTTYYYKVRGYTSKGNGSLSSAIAAYPLETGAITSVKANGSGKLSIRWTAVAGAQRYELYRSTEENGLYTPLQEVNGTTTYQDATVTNGTNYYYKVRAVAAQNDVTGYGEFSRPFMGVSIATARIRKVTSQENGTLLVTWKAVKNAYRYQVYRSTSKNGTYTKLATVKKTSFEDTSAAGAQTYYYKIRTVNRINGVNGYGSYSAAKSGRLLSGTSISKIQTTASTKLKLTWKKAADAEGYKLYRSTSRNGKYRLIKTINSGKKTSYTNTKLTPGKTYYYKIQVIGAGDGAGVLSAAMAGKTVNKTTIRYVQSVSSKKLKVVWKKISGASGYRIYRSTSKNGVYKEIKTITDGTKTSYSDTTVKTGKLYYYKIAVQNKNKKTIGYSENSEPLGGRTVAMPVLAKAKSVSGAKIRISWSAVSRAAGYQVYRSEKEGSGYSRIATITSRQTTTYEDMAPKANTTYYYKVIAYNSVNGVTGTGGYSAEKSYRIEFYEIMGAPGATEAQMVAYYNQGLAAWQAGNPTRGYHYPAEVYGGEAPNVETFVHIIYEEAVAEGVRPEVVLAQTCNETGFLQYTGDVRVEQRNFAGIGATGGGAPGYSFPDVRTGIRAQVQHLKAYACNEPLINGCVDPRFTLVKRGYCKYVEWLGIQENPNTVWNADGTIASGCGWATAKNYGYILMAGVNKILTL